jgi:hypothetical protein
MFLACEEIFHFKSVNGTERKGNEENENERKKNEKKKRKKERSNPPYPRLK